MNKPYIVKWLPVSGEVEEGDRYMLTSPDIIHTCFKTPEGTLSTFLFTSKPKKVKLFLCSRDIKVGDKFFRRYANSTTEHTSEMVCIAIGDGVFYSEGINDTIQSENYLSYKVIGEIPSSCKWVKEDDEYSEEEVAITAMYQRYEPHAFKYNWIRIMGPCGNFH